MQTCDLCQRTNDGKFCKEAAPLHPIPVQPEVWKMVRKLDTKFDNDMARGWSQYDSTRCGVLLRLRY